MADDRPYVYYKFHNVNQLVKFINEAKNIEHINTVLDARPFENYPWNVETLDNVDYFPYLCEPDNSSDFSEQEKKFWRQMNTIELMDGKRKTTLAKLLLVSDFKCWLTNENYDTYSKIIKPMCKIIGIDEFSLTNDYFGFDIEKQYNLRVGKSTHEFIFSNGPRGNDGYLKLLSQNNHEMCKNIIASMLTDYVHMNPKETTLSWIQYYNKVNPNNNDDYYIQLIDKLLPRDSELRRKEWTILCVEQLIRNIYNDGKNKHVIDYIKQRLLEEKSQAYVNDIIKHLIKVNIIKLEDLINII